MLDLMDKVALISGAGSVGEGWGQWPGDGDPARPPGRQGLRAGPGPGGTEHTRAIIEREGHLRGTGRQRPRHGADESRRAHAVRRPVGGIDILVNNVGGRCPAGRS